MGEMHDTPYGRLGRAFGEAAKAERRHAVTSSSPDIESLIAAAQKRNDFAIADVPPGRTFEDWHEQAAVDRRDLLDALVPVYEAAKAVVVTRKPIRNGLVPSTLDRKLFALRSALGEPNA